MDTGGDMGTVTLCVGVHCPAFLILSTTLIQFVDQGHRLALRFIGCRTRRVHVCESLVRISGDRERGIHCAGAIAPLGLVLGVRGGTDAPWFPGGSVPGRRLRLVLGVKGGADGRV
jgi:hypothetical protein